MISFVLPSRLSRTSDMTNKSEIKSWAISMLLRWNELDPVSQKEINRNNAIYNDYQHNRNPFVDHPEYARMIWDPNWQGTTYTVTLSVGVGGTISPSGSHPKWRFGTAGWP